MKDILVVDDIFSIRLAIQDFLSPHFKVVTAGDGQEALKILSEQKFDLLLSDIRMPGMSGIELIQHVQSAYPEMQYVLMTAYNVNDYVKYAQEYRIWNIIPKSTFLDLYMVGVMVRKLTGPDIFGFSLYFPDLTEQTVTIGRVYAMHRDRELRLPSGVVMHCEIQSEEERFRMCDMVAELLIRHRAPKAIRLILEELTINARDYASDQFTHPIQLSFGVHRDYLLFAVADFCGRLNRSDILYRLGRNVSYDEHGRPLSLKDSHGRGLFISRENLDHLIFNIQEGKRTEILGMLQPEAEFRNKAISIYFRTADGRIVQ
jgi:CheY-like chemotaxis protein